MADGRPSERGIVEVADDSGNVIKGVNRLRLGPGLSASYNEADPSVVIDAVGGSAVSVNLAVDNVSALRALSSIVMLVARVAQTSGYSSVGDGGGATYDWVAGNTDADDGAITIKVTAVTSGRWKFRQPASKIFPIAASSIDRTGVTNAGSTLTALSVKLYQLGYHGIDCTGCVFNLVGGDYDIPKRSQGDPWKVIEGTWNGTSSSFAAVITATITVETDATGSGTTINPYNVVYGTRTWIETVAIGQLTMHGVSDIRNMNVGTTVYVRLGAEPTDAGGGAAIGYFAVVTAITPTTGTAGDVTLDRQVPEAPLYPLPSYNLNHLRDGNKHDMFVVTSFQDNITIDRPTLYKTHIAPQFSRGMSIVRPHWTYSSACLSLVYCEHTLISFPWAENVQGFNLDSGNPASDPSANYGWFALINSCAQTVFDNVRIDRISCVGGLLNDEIHSRGTSFTGVTRMIVDWSQLWLCGGVKQTPYSTEPIAIETFYVEGGGTFDTWSPGVRIGNLILGWKSQRPDTAPAAWQGIPANQVSDSIVFRNSTFRSRRMVRMPLVGIPVNGSKTFSIPEHGILRHVRIYSSSVTGVTSFKFKSGTLPSAGVNSMHTLLLPGKTATIEEPSILWFGSSGIYGDKTDIVIETDSSFDASTYFFAEIEILADDGIPGTVVQDDDSSPLIISSNGTPSVNAAFIGQVCFDYTNSNWYDAVNTGTGSSDWKKRGGTGDALTSQPLSQFASTTSAQLRGVMSDETGTGALVFAGGNIGAAAATSVNNVAITAPSTGATLTVADGKTLSAIDDATIGGIFKIAGGSFSSVSSLSASWLALQYTRLEAVLNVGVTGCDPAITLTGISSGTYGSTGAYLTTGGIWSQSVTSGINFWKLPDFVDGGAVRLVIFPVRATGAAIRCLVSGGSGQANGTVIVFTGVSTDAVNQATGINIAFGATSSGYWELWGYK